MTIGKDIPIYQIAITGNEVSEYYSQKSIESFNKFGYYNIERIEATTPENIPSFLIGRTCWDNWLMHYASKNDLNLTDCTSDILCIHQKHDYSHIKTSKNNHYKGIEREFNFKQLGGINKIYDIRDSTFVLKNGILKKNHSKVKFYRKFLRNIGYFFLKEKVAIMKKNIIVNKIS